MAVTEQFKADVLEVLNEMTAALENQTGTNAVPFMDEDELDETVTMPATKWSANPIENSRAQPESYRQVPMTTFFNRIDTLASEVEDATGDLQALKQDTDAAKQAAIDAAQGAENVDVDLDGMTFTIVDRNGQQKTVSLSIDFYETYASVAQMRADIANIPNSALVTIATDNPLDDENAQVYQKRSDGTLKYLFDLDQKSASAWADWLNSKKPQIDASIVTANTDHERAIADHTTADSDHTKAGQDHIRADEDHTTADGDHTQAGNDHTRAENIAAHPPYIADGTQAKPGDAGYAYEWDYQNQTYVRGARVSLDWSTLSQAERDALEQEMLAQIAFDNVPTQDSNKAVRSSGIFTALAAKQDKLTIASDETCESILDELN